jgi:hypothetical protein
VLTHPPGRSDPCADGGSVSADRPGTLQLVPASNDSIEVDAPRELTVGQVDALADMLHHGSRFMADEQLTVAPAIEELALFMEDHATGRRNARTPEGKPTYLADRKSLVGDVDLALRDAGPGLGGATTPSIKDLRARLTTVKTVIESPVASAEFAADLRSALGQLGKAETMRACWDDLLAAVANDQTPNPTLGLRAAQLDETSELYGHTWKISETDIPILAGRGKLDAIRKRLIEPSFQAADVAWVAFGNAHLRQGFQRLGPIQFFDQRFTNEQIRDGCPELDAHSGFDPAPELTDEVLGWHFARIQAEHYVLARVELTGPRAAPSGTDHPVRRARELVSAVVESAGFLTGGSEWVLLDGGSAFGGEHRAGSAGFDDPEKVHRQRTLEHPTHEMTSWGLIELPATFADAVKCGDPIARRALTELEWHHRTTRIRDAAMRLIQHVRVFETQWVTGRGAEFNSWEQGVRKFLKEQWCWHAVQDALFAAVASIETPHHPLKLKNQQDSNDALKAAFDEIWNQGDDLFKTYSWRPGVVLRLAAEVADHFFAGSVQRRRWRELDRLGRTGGDAYRWIEQREQAFDVLLNRAVRQRNAIVHGQSLVPAVINSVEPFLDQLGGSLVRRWIDAAGGGLTVEEELESNRARLRARFDGLRDAPSGFDLWPVGD